MAHVKCRYDHYWCSMYNEKCMNCYYSPDNENQCDYLECDPGYFEKTSKNVDFDGRLLFVGKDLFAHVDDDVIKPEAEDNVIEYLEIDGIVYCGEKKDDDT